MFFEANFQQLLREFTKDSNLDSRSWHPVLQITANFFHLDLFLFRVC
jgi:hypothetical protein